jgi:threonine dehydrogenase-like Zn-dependent dehydrogenase
MTKMRAVRITEPGGVAVEQVDVPEPGPGQVRIALEGTGVCASNLGPWEGLPWLDYPMPPGEGGHEAWGRVEAVGEGVDESWIGTRVAALCYCAFAERDLADARTLVPLPPSLDGVAFPGEPFGCAMNIFRRSAIEPEQWVAVVGVGFLGACLVRLAKQAGARVIGISRREFARDVARRMGADEVIPMEDHGAILHAVAERTEGRLCDRVLECAGKPWPLDLAAELTRERGRLVIAGYHQDGPRQVNMQLWNWRGLDVINAHERDPAAYVRGIREAVEAVERGVFDPAALLTHAYPLERLDEALNATAERPDGFLKATVRP